MNVPYPLAPPPPVPSRRAPNPGDLVHWRHVIRRGQKEEELEGYGVVSEIGVDVVIVWPITGGNDRKVRCAPPDVLTLVEHHELIHWLDEERRKVGR